MKNPVFSLFLFSVLMCDFYFPILTSKCQPWQTQDVSDGRHQSGLLISRFRWLKSKLFPGWTICSLHLHLQRRHDFSIQSSCPDSFLTFASISLLLQGNVTFSCSQPQLVSCTFLSSSSSFLSLPAAAATGGFAVRFQFRTWNPDGLLLSLQLNPEPQRLELRISNSRLFLTLQNSGRQKSEVSVGESLRLRVLK